MNLRNMLRKKPGRTVLLGAVMVLMLTGAISSCGSDSHNTSNDQRTWYYEYEFAANPGLSAAPDQVVILDIVPGESESAHRGIPYYYSTGGGYLYAIPSDDPFVFRAEILDRSGVLVATVRRGDGGVYLDMDPGDYTIRVYHDGTEVPETGAAAFIYQQETETLTAGAADPVIESDPIPYPYPAYVALQFVGGDYDGDYLTIDTKGIWNDHLKLEYIKVLRAASPNTESALFAERNHLFALKPDPYGRCLGDGYPSFAGFYGPYSWPAEDTGLYFTSYMYYCHWHEDWALPCPPSQDKPFVEGYAPMPIFRKSDQLTVSFAVEDLGDGTFTIWPAQ